MKKYCSVCKRKIGVNKNGKVCRHGFKRNRWVFINAPEIPGETEYMKVDGSPCRGSGKIGLTLKQLEKRKNGSNKQK